MDYEFTHSCGHDGEPSGKLRSISDVRYWQKRIAGEPCKECRRAAERVEAAARAEASGLPTLTGTPKQIAYGNVLREQKLGRLKEALVSMRTQIEVGRFPNQAVDKIEDGIALVSSEWRQQTEAKFWIEAVVPDPWTLVLHLQERGVLWSSEPWWLDRELQVCGPKWWSEKRP